MSAIFLIKSALRSFLLESECYSFVLTRKTKEGMEERVLSVIAPKKRELKGKSDDRKDYERSMSIYMPIARELTHVYIHNDIFLEFSVYAVKTSGKVVGTFSLDTGDESFFVEHLQVTSPESKLITKHLGITV